MLSKLKIEICFFRFIFVAFVVIIPLIVLKSAYDYTLIKLNTAQVLVLAAAFYIYVKSKQTVKTGCLVCRQTFSPLRVFFLCLLGYLIVCFVSTLSSPYRYASLNEFSLFISYLGIMFMAVAGISRRDIKVIVFAWLFSSVLAAGYGLYQAFGHKTITSTFGNPNFMAAYLILVLPVVVGQFIYYCQAASGSMDIKSDPDSCAAKADLRGLYKIIALAVVALILLAGIIVSRARGAWLGLIVSGIVIGVLILSGCKRRLRIFFGIIIIGFIIVSIIFGSALFDQVLEDVRPLIWKGAFNMIKASPVTGHGLGGFFIVYPEYRLQEYFLHPQRKDITRHVHCEYLEMISETGLLGFLFFAGMMVFFFYAVFCRVTDLKIKKPAYSKFVLIGLAGGLAGFLTHNLVSVNMRFPACAVFFWFSLGIGLGLIKELSGNEPVGLAHGFSHTMPRLVVLPRISPQIIGLLFSIVILISITIHSIKTDLIAGIYFKKGLRSRAGGDWLRAVDYYQKAIIFDPYFIMPYYRLAYAYAAAGDLDRAIQTYEKVLSLAPYYARAQANLGLLYSRKPDKDKALFYLRQAEELNPYDKAVLMELALIYSSQGDKKKTVGYLKRVLRLEPEHEAARCLLREVLKQ